MALFVTSHEANYNVMGVRTRKQKTFVEALSKHPAASRGIPKYDGSNFALSWRSGAPVEIAAQSLNQLIGHEAMGFEIGMPVGAKTVAKKNPKVL